jgi:hypothetical protein
MGFNSGFKGLSETVISRFPTGTTVCLLTFSTMAEFVSLVAAVTLHKVKFGN